MADFKNFSFNELNRNSGKLYNAVKEGSRTVLLYHGKPAAVVISIDEYEKLTGSPFANFSFKESKDGKKRKEKGK